MMFDVTFKGYVWRPKCLNDFLDLFGSLPEFTNQDPGTGKCEMDPWNQGTKWFYLGYLVPFRNTLNGTISRGKFDHRMCPLRLEGVKEED